MDKNFEVKLRQLIADIYYEQLLDEITTTGDVEGYSTPHAFSDDEEKRKRKLKPALKAIGYKLVKEDISREDLDFLKKVIRKEVAAILRDIWIKRTSWA